MITNNIGGRNTLQRIKVLEYLKGDKSHPNAERVYNAIKKEIPTISLATVYRNLNLLAEQGKILKLNINNEAHFDGDTNIHQHGVCRNCGKIFDFFINGLEKKAINEAEKNKIGNEFNAEYAEIIFKGTCRNCRK